MQYTSVAPKATTRKRRANNDSSSSSSCLGQKSLFDMVPYEKSGTRHNTLVKAVTNYITSGCVPMYTVDKPAFKDLLKALDSRFQCPSRNYFSSTAIPTAYDNLKVNITEELKGIPYISCTTDGWSSLAKDPYISLTAHYVSDDWVLKTRCLSTMYAPESHTAENLAQFTRDGLQEYGVYTSQLVSLTTDSAANMVAACHNLKVQRFSCFGHVLHNAISTTLGSNDEIQSLLRSSRRIVAVFSYSFKYRSQLQKLQKELELPQSQLINDVATRWGSKLKMLKRLSANLSAVDALFVEG